MAPKRVLGGIAVVGFGASLVVHLLTVAGLDVSERMPYVFGPHFGIFVVFLPFLISSDSNFHRRPSLGDIISGAPTWSSILIVLLLAYGVVNFLVCGRLMEGGGAEIVNGEYVLANHGKVLAHIGETEYHLRRAYELRMFSGGWLLFYWVPAVYFLFWQAPTSVLDRRPV